MDQQEYLIKLQMLEQQANQFGEQLHIIDKQIVELKMLKTNMENLQKSTETEMFSEIGKGIYIKGQLTKGNLLVDVGQKILVQKTPDEVKAIVEDQVHKFDQVKIEIGEHIDQVNKELDEMMQKAHESEKKE